MYIIYMNKYAYVIYVCTSVVVRVKFKISPRPPCCGTLLPYPFLPSLSRYIPP